MGSLHTLSHVNSPYALFVAITSSGRKECHSIVEVDALGALLNSCFAALLSNGFLFSVYDIIAGNIIVTTLTAITSLSCQVCCEGNALLLHRMLSFHVLIRECRDDLFCCKWL